VASTLHTATGIASGYLNVFTSLGWVVRNLPVLSTFPYPRTSTSFHLSSTNGVNVASLGANVQFSASPVVTFGGGPLTTFSVGDAPYDAEGRNVAITGPPPVPPSPGSVTFVLGGLIDAKWQTGHPAMIQTADNQCGPAAIAHSMNWLDQQYGIWDPPGSGPPHVPGLGVVPAGSDGSMVGDLDEAMMRGGTDRKAGDPVSDPVFMTGKLQFIADNELCLSIKHQARNMQLQMDFSHAGQTSLFEGSSPSTSFIKREICAGEDVELGWSYPGGGGHWVSVTGCGTVLGLPFVSYTSDTVQSPDDCTAPPDAIPDNEGTGSVCHSFVHDTDGDGLLNLVNEPGLPNIDIVVAESPIAKVPTAPTWTLVLLALGVVGVCSLLLRRPR
jgi:hypothetical protein